MALRLRPCKVLSNRWISDYERMSLLMRRVHLIYFAVLGGMGVKEDSIKMPDFPVLEGFDTDSRQNYTNALTIV